MEKGDCFQKVTGVSGIMLTLLLIGVLTLTFHIQPATASLPVHNIDTEEDFATIQAAIDDPDTLDGHTILVDTEIYPEHVTINKSISLIGENRSTTIIDGEGSGNVVTVASPNIVLTGFTIRKGGADLSGIRVESGSSGSTILGNKITDCLDGVIVDSSLRVKIIGNEIYAVRAYGIDLTNTYRSIVEGNKITNGTTGLVLHASYGNNISNNTLADLRYGMLLYNSGNNTLRNNNMTGNERNFGVGGGYLKDYLNDIDVSNTVNGLPIVYLVNQSNLIVDTIFPQAGYLGIINSQNITVKNQNLANNINGLLLAYTNNSKIDNVNISNNRFGMDFWFSNNNTVTQSTSYNNEEAGIRLTYASSNSIKNTVITNCGTGLQVIYFSKGNVIKGNIVSNNPKGFQIADSYGNRIYHNNLINNTVHAESHDLTNTWDNGYPSGGNYWSDYTGADTNMDGIGEDSYEINSNNIDRYPLMGMFSNFPVSWQEKTYHITIVCNSTISAFQFDQTNRIIRFNVTGEEGIGFCRVCIPHDLMELHTVTVDEHSPQYVNYTLYDNGTHRWVYFTYQHSTHEVIISSSPVGGIYVPVSKLSLLAPYIGLTILLAVAFITVAYVKKRKRNTEIIS